MRSVSLGWLDPERCSTALQRIRGLDDLRSNVSNQAINVLSHWLLEERTRSHSGAAFGMEISWLCVGKVDSSIRHTTRHLRMNVAKQDLGRESRRSGLSQLFRERPLNTAHHPRQINVSGWLQPVTWTWVRGQQQPEMPKDWVCGYTDVPEVARCRSSLLSPKKSPGDGALSWLKQPSYIFSRAFLAGTSSFL